MSSSDMCQADDDDAIFEQHLGVYIVLNIYFKKEWLIISIYCE